MSWRSTKSRNSCIPEFRKRLCATRQHTCTRAPGNPFRAFLTKANGTLRTASHQTVESACLLGSSSRLGRSLPRIANQAANRIGRLCALADPVISAAEIEIGISGLLLGIVIAD